MEALNNKAAEVMTTYAKDIGPGNPFEAAPMQVLAPYLANKRIPFYDKLVSKMPNQAMDPQSLLQLAKNAISEDVVTADEAAEGIANMFKVAVAHNNTSQGGFARVGLPNQESYKTTVHLEPSITEGIFGFFKENVFSPPLIYRTVKKSIVGEDIAGAIVGDAALGRDLRVNMVDPVEVANALTRIHMDNAPAPLPNTSNEGTNNVK
jgi:hypothetical protein